MEISNVKLKELRDQKMLSLRDLSERSGVGYATIHRIEQGKTSSAHQRTIRKLAAALDVEPMELVVKEEVTG